MTDRAMAARDLAAARGEAHRFVDVDYARLVGEPLAVVEELYAAAGVELSAARPRRR